MQPHDDELFRSAVAFQNEGKIPQAERLHRLILSRNPCHAGALQGLGLIAMATGHLEDAERLMRRSIELQPGVALFHSNFAEALRRRGNLDAAVDELKRAIAIDPSQADYY